MFHKVELLLLVFLISIDDLVKIVKCIPIQFADDNTLIARAIQERLQVQEINDDCINFKSWSLAWRQPVAPTKTGYMRFTNPSFYKNFEKTWERLGTTEKSTFMVKRYQEKNITKF